MLTDAFRSVVETLHTDPTIFSRDGSLFTSFAETYDVLHEKSHMLWLRQAMMPRKHSQMHRRLVIHIQRLNKVLVQCEVCDYCDAVSQYG